MQFSKLIDFDFVVISVDIFLNGLITYYLFVLISNKFKDIF